MSSAAQKMTKARANLVMAHPFFGSLALRLKMAETDELDTAGCDGVTLYYNPKFVDELSFSKVQGLLAHEVMHPAFLHHTRRGSRDKKNWNIACDYAINSLLQKAGFDLPNGGCINQTYDGMSAEQIYGLLPEDPPGDNSNGDSGNGGNDNDPGGDGGVMDSPNSQNCGSSQSQQQHEEAEWKVAVAQAAHVAKQAGQLPGDLDRLIEELFEPVLPWRAILRRFMTEKSNDDFSWKRGNRRFLAQGLYLPSRQSDDAMGEIVVVIDTSGSIGKKELTEFGSEVKSIIDETRPHMVRVIYCDSKIAHIDEYSPDDDIQFKAHGGGGTDFRPPFTWLENNQIVPKAVVYLTDGHGPFPEQEPDFPVLWVINNYDVTPPHGEHLILEV